MSETVKNPVLIQRLISLIDLTSLNESDTEASIAAFCEKAQTPLGHVAAVCVYPSFARLVAAQFLGTAIKTATVANFPSGADSLESVLAVISRALQDGVQEIDVVFPYQRYLAGERDEAQSFVAACKAVCGPKVSLKVILETGALQDAATIAAASQDVLRAGADFIKTSTGKIPQGATLEVVTIMLLAIRELGPELKRPLGLKIAGGIREFSQAVQFLDLAGTIMGPKWATPHTFRIGASKLLDELL
jgi:deoxyribose-phosphate aldolase